MSSFNDSLDDSLSTTSNESFDNEFDDTQLTKGEPITDSEENRITNTIPFRLHDTAFIENNVCSKLFQDWKNMEFSQSQLNSVAEKLSFGVKDGNFAIQVQTSYCFIKNSSNKSSKHSEHALGYRVEDINSGITNKQKKTNKAQNTDMKIKSKANFQNNFKDRPTSKEICGINQSTDNMGLEEFFENDPKEIADDYLPVSKVVLSKKKIADEAPKNSSCVDVEKGKTSLSEEQKSPANQLQLTPTKTKLGNHRIIMRTTGKERGLGFPQGGAQSLVEQNRKGFSNYCSKYNSLTSKTEVTSQKKESSKTEYPKTQQMNEANSALKTEESLKHNVRRHRSVSAHNQKFEQLQKGRQYGSLANSKNVFLQNAMKNKQHQARPTCCLPSIGLPIGPSSSESHCVSKNEVPVANKKTLSLTGNSTTTGSVLKPLLPRCVCANSLNFYHFQQKTIGSNLPFVTCGASDSSCSHYASCGNYQCGLPPNSRLLPSEHLPCVPIHGPIYRTVPNMSHQRMFVSPQTQHSYTLFT